MTAPGSEIGPNGMMTVYLSLEVDDRLREVSSRYILSQSARFTSDPEEAPALK
jgi:hypothetical protein